MLSKVVIEEKMPQIKEYWDPHIIAELNGQLVKLAKIKGDFPWHHHENEDELFQVVKGSMQINLKDQCMELQEGELIVIPRGVEHQPSADSECWILLFEPPSTFNTGNQPDHELSRSTLKRI